MKEIQTEINRISHGKLKRYCDKYLNEKDAIRTNGNNDIKGIQTFKETPDDILRG